MTVAELKRHIDRRFLTKRGFRRELKRELARFATKDELKRELTRFATRDDLKRYATRDDLNELRNEMRCGFADLRTDILRVLDEHEHRITDLESLRRV